MVFGIAVYERIFENDVGFGLRSHFAPVARSGRVATRISHTKEKKASFLCLCVGFALTENQRFSVTK